jgi:hypothetical protein
MYGIDASAGCISNAETGYRRDIGQGALASVCAATQALQCYCCEPVVFGDKLTRNYKKNSAFSCVISVIRCERNAVDLARLQQHLAS